MTSSRHRRYGCHSSPFFAFALLSSSLSLSSLDELVELPSPSFVGVLRCNGYGDESVEGALAAGHAEPQALEAPHASIVGNYSLLPPLSPSLSLTTFDGV